MSNRRIVMAVALFAAAAVILILLNRFSASLLPGKKEAPAAPAAKSVSGYKIFLYDAQTGLPSGDVTAVTYQPQPDGWSDCTDVAVNWKGTALGDVKLKSDHARLKLGQVGQKVSGIVNLDGNVTINAVKEGRTTVSGKFEKVSYDADTAGIEATGPLEIHWGEGVSLKGIGLHGTVEKRRTKLTVEKNIVAEVEENLLGKDSSGGGTLNVTAGGPMIFEGEASQITFDGGVKMERRDLHLTGRKVRLAFEAAGDSAAQGASAQTKPGPLPGMPQEMKARAIEIIGPAVVETPQVKAAGDYLYWQAEDGRARLEGQPARFALGESFIEAPAIEANVNEAGSPFYVKAGGPGKARIREGDFGSKSGMSGDLKGPLDLAWSQSLLYDAPHGNLAIAGAVGFTDPPYTGRADRITMALAPAGVRGNTSGRMRGLELFGGVAISDGKQGIKADRVAFDETSGLVTCSGAPVVATLPDGSRFSSRLFTYSPSKELLSSQMDCRFDTVVSTGEASAHPGTENLSVLARRVTADMSGRNVTAQCSGGVTVNSSDGTLTCETLDVTGAPAGQGKPGSMLIKGGGKVHFTKDAFTADAEALDANEAKKTVVLSAPSSVGVEMRYGDSATIWASTVTIEGAADSAVCADPKVVFSAPGSMLGFVPEGGGRAPAGQGGQTKVYLDASKMTAARRSADMTLLTFDGNVRAVGRNTDAPVEDRITADQLSFDVKMPPQAASAADAPGKGTQVTAARAKGNVALRYAAQNDIMEGRGTAFEWTREGNLGRLTGDPASVWRNDVPATKANEFIYDFATRQVSIRGGQGGTIVMER